MNVQQKAIAYAENARLRNTPCYCNLCKEKADAELLASVQQITERWPMPNAKPTVIHFRSKR